MVPRAFTPPERRRGAMRLLHPGPSAGWLAPVAVSAQPSRGAWALPWGPDPAHPLYGVCTRRGGGKTLWAGT